MRVLVTGGAGFIGAHCVEALVQRGHQVRVLVQPGDPAPNLASLPVERLEADVRDAGGLAPACVGQEAVLHLAAIPSDWAPRDQIEAVNVGGTRNLMAAALGQGVRRFVLVSSLAVHDSSGHLQSTETAPRDRRGLPYADSKRMAEDIVLSSAHRSRIEGVVIRPGLVPFGPRDRLFSAPLCRAIRGGVLPLIRSGRARLCTSYVENLAEGLCLALASPEAAGEVFVMADEEVVSWRSLFARFALALGVPRARFPGLPWAPLHGVAWAMETVYGGLGLRSAPPLTRYRVDLMRRDYHFTSRKARERLGYRPTVGLDEAVRRTVAWVEAEAEGGSGDSG